MSKDDNRENDKDILKTNENNINNENSLLDISNDTNEEVLNKENKKIIKKNIFYYRIYHWNVSNIFYIYEYINSKIFTVSISWYYNL